MHRHVHLVLWSFVNQLKHRAPQFSRLLSSESEVEVGSAIFSAVECVLSDKVYTAHQLGEQVGQPSDVYARRPLWLYLDGDRSQIYPRLMQVLAKGCREGPLMADYRVLAMQRIELLSKLFNHCTALRRRDRGEEIQQQFPELALKCSRGMSRECVS
jgi:hypothetical protein